jgi:hypothetical protein
VNSIEGSTVDRGERQEATSRHTIDDATKAGPNRERLLMTRRGARDSLLPAGAESECTVIALANASPQIDAEIWIAYRSFHQQLAQRALCLSMIGSATLRLTKQMCVRTPNAPTLLSGPLLSRVAGQLIERGPQP